jgi:hypothetical protein
LGGHNDEEKDHCTFLLTAMALSLLSSCGKDESAPDADAPEPPAHGGVFRSEYGTLTFLGDGQSVTVFFSDDFAAQAGLPEGECLGSYVFKFRNGAYRCDRADTFELYLDGTAYQFRNRWLEMSETAICLASPLAAGETLRFEK